jgi:hypothetical protein
VKEITSQLQMYVIIFPLLLYHYFFDSSISWTTHP